MLKVEYYAVRDFGTDSPTAARIYWSTALGIAYRFAMLAVFGSVMPNVSVTRNDVLRFTPRYGVYGGFHEFHPPVGPVEGPRVV